MRFDVVIDGQTKRAAYIGKTMRVFREQFKQDLQLLTGEKMTEYLMLLAQYKAEMEESNLADDDNVQLGIVIKGITPEFAEKVLWACLYAEDDSMPLYEDWLDTIEDYPTMLLYGAICFQVVAGAHMTVQADVEEESDGKKVGWFETVVAARNAGYSLKEIDELDVSYLLDLLVTQVNLMNRNKKKTQKPNARKATQADFDLM